MESDAVTIYTTPTCSYCKMAKEFFKEHDIQYEEKDVTKDPQARERMVEKSKQMGVPVITIGDEVMVGFTKNRDALLKWAGLHAKK